MRFKTENDLKTISINEMKIEKMRLLENTLELTMEGARIAANNPHNNRFEEVYSMQTQVLFRDVSLHAFREQGYKYYDADGNLLDEVPSKDLSEEERKQVVEEASGDYVYQLTCLDEEQGIWLLIFDVEDEDNCIVDTFEIEFTFGSSLISWDRFAGPVDEKS